MSKLCRKCNQDKPSTEFYKNSRQKDGLQAWCKLCHKQSNNDWYATSVSRRNDIARRRLERVEVLKDVIRAYLSEHPCVDCGEDDMIVLDFDHVRGEKVAHIAHMMRDQVAVATLEAEIAKCDVRCANCHRRVTAARTLAAGGTWWRTNDIAV